MRKKLSMIAFIIVLVSNTILSGAAPLVATAETVKKSIFQNVTLTDEKGNVIDSNQNPAFLPNIDTTVNIHFDWSLADLEVSEGETYSYKLPVQMISKEENGKLLTSGNLDIGTYNVANDGLVTIVFNEEADMNANGMLAIKANFNKDVIGDKETVSIPFTFNNQEKEIPVSFQVDSKPESEADQQEDETKQTEAADEIDKEKAEVATGATEEEAEDKEEAKSNSDKKVLNAEVKRNPKPIAENIIIDGSLVLKKVDGSSIEEGEMLDPAEGLRIEFDWALSNTHDYIAGDTYELQLPEQLAIYNEINDVLTDGNTVFGTYKVTIDGKVLFTFNEHIEKVPNVHGHFYVQTELSEQKIITTENILEFKVNDKVIKEIPINVKPKYGQAIAKSGQPVGGSFNAAEIAWTVIVNTSRESLENAIIQDPILSGQELIVESIVLKEVEVDINGNVLREKDGTVALNNNSTKEKLELELGNTNKAYKLTFRTKIKEDEKDKEGATTYYNTAKLVSDNKKNAESGSSVSISRPKSLEKTSSAFNKGDRSIEWTVNANFTEKELKAGETITDEFTFKVGNDTLNNIFEVVDIKIFQVDSFENGKVKDQSQANDLFNIHFDGNKVTFTLKEDTNKAFIFKYKTKVKDGAYITDDGNITNEVLLKGKTAKSSQGVYQQVGKKNHGEINYKDKTIDWTITVNADNQDLRNFVLTDKFPGSGQKLVPGTIKISPEASAHITENEEGFVINFGNITKAYTITYQTQFTYDFGSAETKPIFTNGLHLSYETSDEGKYELEIEDKVDPNHQTKNNGVKNGSVNNETKEITWTVDINYNQLSLEGAKFVDKIANNQTLVKGSVQVFKTTIGEKGGIAVGDDVTENFAVTTDNDEIKINLDEIVQSYRIVFKTVDKDGIYNSNEKYENTAQFIPREGEEHNLKAHVTLPHQGEFLGKKGVHNIEDWTIDWTIEVNKSKSTLTDIIVIDDLGDKSSQVLLEDSIEVTKVGSDKPLVFGEDYDLVVDDNKFTLKIKGETSDTYVVKYSSYILAKETTNIKNNAEVKSNNEVVGTTKKEESVQVRISSGGGPTQGGTGELIIEKVEDGSNKPLADVAFVLKTTVGNKEIIVREGTTNANGKLHWTGLKYGTYTLEETVPAGYLAETPLTIELKYDEMPEGIKTKKIVNKRQTGSAKIVKKDAVTDETLANATFKITNLETTQAYTFTTNNQGIAEANVPYGEYSVKEIMAPQGYKIASELNNIKIEIGKTTEITIDNHAIVNVSGEKKWIDGDGENRPESIKVQLLDGDTVVAEKAVTARDNWKYTFNALPKYDKNGNEINYIIKEVPIDGYISEVDGNNITNIELMDISGAKTWKDGNSANRPESIKVNLLRNAIVVNTIEVTANDEWKYSFTDLEKYNNEGKAYEYAVKEQSVPGYKSEVNGFDIKNTRSEKTFVEVTKSWLDGESKDRPDSITVILFQNEKEIDSAEVRASADWKYVFTDLEAYDENGVAYEYTIKEERVEGYESTVEGYDIINLRVGKTFVSGTKTWKDDNAEGDRPESITVELLQNGKVIDSKEVTATDYWKYSFTDLEEFDENGIAYKYTVQEQPVDGYQSTVKGYDITNVRVGITSVEGTKTWKDDNSKDRPEMIKVNLLQNGVVVDTHEVTADADWKYSFKDLDKYDGEGKAYEYAVKEQGVLGYKSEVDGFDITNTRSDKTSVVVTKGWKDDNTKDRPSSITVNLLQNGEVINTVEVTAAADWTYEFSGLEAYDEDGVAYEYNVEEEAIEGYETTINGFDITNLRVGKTSVEGTKIWKDDNSKDRPEMIKVNIFQNGVVVDTQEVTADSDWKYSFTDLAKYDEEGKEYDYSVKEQGVPGYKSEVDGFDITNTRSDKTSVAITKGWKDDDSEERPDSITVNLLQNSEVIDTVKVTAVDNWTYEFSDLEAYDENGVAYEYTVEEEAIEGYETTVDGYDITNLRVGKASVEGTKTWKDDNSKDRPEVIKVDLLQNGKVIFTKEVKFDTDWKYSFTDLDKYDENGKAYEYSVKEQSVEGYQSTVNGYDITNLRVGKTSVEGTKRWKDDNFKDRPEMIKVDLLQNDKVIDTKEVTADTGWKYSFTDLEKYDEEGKAYTYSVKEHVVEGYESIVSGFDITNELILGDVKLIKVDSNNKEITLEGAEFELQDGDGNVLIKGLSTDKAGKLVVGDLKPGNYQFVETQAPSGYDLDPTPITFTIEKGQEDILVIEFANKATIPVVPEQPEKPSKPEQPSKPEKPSKDINKLPQTGEQTLLYMMIIGFLFLSIGGVLLLRRNRKAE
ncbi:Cna B-type domain-containing protein [Bacillus sp. FJAT-49711]|uniref:Cna B-type domain-containing protein n=1 Tax=Bacillus sp. FJAT-49711 TaxID=2833585 RepID=UPI001BCA336B|nr:Cna B-type domain-containing protein [Bacillus sp. FJAT-49711]MBS4220696.1 Cna B-type domain-containing protein [Bacillus sp. FJAT-49711]